MDNFGKCTKFDILHMQKSMIWSSTIQAWHQLKHLVNSTEHQLIAVWKVTMHI